MGRKMPVVSMDSKGRVLIPKELREKVKLKLGDSIEVEVRETELVLKPIRRDPSRELAALLRGFEFSREDRRRAVRSFSLRRLLGEAVSGRNRLSVWFE